MTMSRIIALSLRFFAILLTSMTVLGPADFALAVTGKEKAQEAAVREALQRMNAVQQMNVDRYNASQQLFQTVQEKTKAVKTEQGKAELAATAKMLLTNALDAMIGHVETLQTKVQQLRGVTESDRTALLSELQPNLAWLTEQRARAASGAPADIKRQASDVRAQWPSIRADVKRVTGGLRAARIHTLNTTMEGYVKTLEDGISTFTSAGKNTGKLQSLLATYKNKAATVAAQYNQAVLVFQQIRDAATMQQLFQQGNSLLDTAQEAIQEGQTALRAMVTEMRNLEKAQ